MRNNKSFGRVLGYHACEQEVANRVLANKDSLRASTNYYDWLGEGIYFWVDSKDRATDWAIEQMDNGRLEDPCVIGAVIDLGHCLVLYEEEGLKEVRDALADLAAISEELRLKLPKNTQGADGMHLLRYSDCAAINLVHLHREEELLPAYDSVIGVFEEGDPIFPGSSLRQKTHIQVAVVNPDCIVATFLPKENF